MKKLKQTIILAFLILIMVFAGNQYVFADAQNANVDEFIKRVPYSKEYERWLNLSESERENTIQPKMYNDLYTPFVVTNPIYQAELLGASLSSSYDLRNVIKDNVAIRNQYDTSSCWAFAGLSSLETNLALRNKTEGKDLNKVYDYSERHVNYATTRMFTAGRVNEMGFNRSPSSGGQWLLIESYLTNGQGAISEEQMPFENNENIIDISEIENKFAETRVYDTVYFKNYNALTGTDKEDAMNEIKQHIQSYGSVFASIHGDTADSIKLSCYNNDTGAKYCSNSTTHSTDHAVSIIGWDDEYAIENFAQESRPSSKGAWIVRNSWGDAIEYDLAAFKQEVYNMYTSQCNSRGWYSAEEIPDSFIEEATGYNVVGDKLVVPIGDNGYMYVSYEDCNVAKTLYGISKADDKVDYDYIYQYNEFYPVVQITLNTKDTILFNTFEKQSNGAEYLTGVSIIAPETYTCRVFVNPNGTGKSKDELQLVELAAGESETFAKGYHTLEFANPVEITGKQFAVAVEITGTRNSIDILTESKIPETTMFDYVKTETEKCYVASSADMDNCNWFDLGKLGEQSASLTNGDSSLKAFTVSNSQVAYLNKLEIVTPPNKTEYDEGENFDKTGMKIRAIYSDDTYEFLEDSDYNISNGTDLKADQTYVTITYKTKSVNQEIKVNKIEKPEPDLEPEPEPQPEPTKEEPAVSSNFSNAKCTLADIKAFYQNDSTTKYVLINTEIGSVARNMNNDKYEYYYYLSSKSGLTNIPSWIKITENQTNSDKLVFQIDSRKLQNYDEIAKATNLYIYIKETVTKGGNQSATVSKAIKFEIGSTAIDTYVNGAKTQTYNAPNTTTDTNGGGSSSSNAPVPTTQDTAQASSTTKSNSKLPYTGPSLIVIGIIVIIAVGIVLFIRYERLNRYFK